MKNQKFGTNRIEEIQFELTSKCNLRCPQCPRNLMGDRLNPYLPICDIPLDQIKKLLSETEFPSLKHIFFCGGYGDPIVYKPFLELIHYIRSIKPMMYILIHTNGSMHNIDWWTNLGNAIGEHGLVVFGIDGVNDSAEIYRRGSNYDKVLQNAQAFIDTGTNARWNYLVFKHNEHDIETARQTSIDMGFAEFLVRPTGRFFNQIDFDEFDKWPIYNKSGNIEGYIEPPENTQYRNKSLLNKDNIVSEFGSMESYFEQTDIECDALLNNKITITSEGLVMPCNFFMHALNDARFHEPVIQMPGSKHPITGTGPNTEIQELINEWGGKDNFSIYHNTFDEIMELGFWDDIVDRMSRDKFKDGRLFECSLTCGKAFTKCWDQGGNKK